MRKCWDVGLADELELLRTEGRDNWRCVGVRNVS